MRARHRGEGSIYRRGRVFWIKYSIRGRTYRESSHSSSLREAGVLLRVRLSDIAAGHRPPNAERVQFEALERLVVEDYRINERRSILRLQQAFRHMHSRFRGSRAIDITAEQISEYVRVRLDEGAARATIANELAALRRGFNLAIRVGLLHKRPAFPVIRIENARAGFFEANEFKALLAELPGDLHGPVTFAYLTGWRMQSEVLQLKWSHIDFGAGVVRLDHRSTKNGDGREFPLNALPQLRQLVERQHDAARRLESLTGDKIPLVFSRSGKPIRDLRTAWKSACKRAGVEGRIPHDFRRTAVRNLERAGVSRSVAMQLVGHRTESVYRRYAIVSSRDLAEGVRRLAGLHSAPSSETARPAEDVQSSAGV